MTNIKIIDKQSAIFANNNYLLLGIDNNNNKYYILNVDTDNKIPRIGFVYIAYNDNVVDIIDYEEYINELNQITNSTLTTEELTILTNILNHIKSLTLAYRIVLNTGYGVDDIQPNTEKLTKEYKNDVLIHYSKISNLLQ